MELCYSTPRADALPSRSGGHASGPLQRELLPSCPEATVRGMVLILQVLCVNFVSGVGRRCPKIFPCSTKAVRPCSTARPPAGLAPSSRGQQGHSCSRSACHAVFVLAPHSAVELASGAHDPLLAGGGSDCLGSGPVPKALHAASVWGHSQLRAASCLWVGRRQGQASAPGSPWGSWPETTTALQAQAPRQPSPAPHCPLGLGRSGLDCRRDSQMEVTGAHHSAP